MNGAEDEAVPMVVNERGAERQPATHVPEGVVADDGDVTQGLGDFGPQRANLRAPQFCAPRLASPRLANPRLAGLGLRALHLWAPRGSAPGFGTPPADIAPGRSGDRAPSISA